MRRTRSQGFPATHQSPRAAPIQPAARTERKGRSGHQRNAARGKNEWDASAKQLHDAIHLLVVCWGSPPGQALLEIKTKLERFSDRPPFASQVKAINTIIGKDARNRTLVKMVNDLAKNNSIKTYEFSLLVITCIYNWINLHSMQF
ncbi:hypothetical protein SAMN05216339_11526 [Nitrosomonas eutropha]|uniref:Uncharacterized protein n=1 Tax=Nitrosomonas eutropha TaxID=916 RepID=A0A1I7J7D2_9PROT|nr:hypothetical protein [Nitrosomonas eutropha]SFU81095.1 hypothetical protein SAMN05216339_11526 [Nitrosomonas eutropha]